MSKSRILVWSLLSMCLFLPSHLYAANNTTEINMQKTSGKETAGEKAVTDYVLAMKFIDYGKQQNNPMAVLVGMQILKAVPTPQPLTITKISTTGNVKKHTKTAIGPLLIEKKYNLDTLLQLAREMAKNDPHVLALLQREADRKTIKTRGSAEGPRAYKDIVSANSVDTFQIEYKGEELTKVALIGSGACDLDLIILDERNNEITRDTRDSVNAIAEWTPKWTGSFSLKVINIACDKESEYLLLTN